MSDPAPYPHALSLSQAAFAAALVGQAPVAADAQARPILTSLAAHRVTLNLRLWSGPDASTETSMMFPDAIGLGGGVVANRLATGEIAVSGLVDGETPARLVAAMLPPDRPVPVFALQLAPPALMALAALLDIGVGEALTRRVAAAQERRPVAAQVVTDMPAIGAAAVAGWLASLWGVGGFGQLTTFVMALGLMETPPDRDAIAQMLEPLARQGLLIAEPRGRYRPAELLEPLASLRLGLAAGLQWQRLTRLDDTVVETSERLFLLGPEGCMLELSATAAGLIRMAMVGRRQVVDFIARDCVAGPPRPAVPRVQDAPVKRFCGACGARLNPGARFCGACGKAV